jgi:hypothetical protein
LLSLGGKKLNVQHKVGNEIIIRQLQ